MPYALLVTFVAIGSTAWHPPADRSRRRSGVPPLNVATLRIASITSRILDRTRVPVSAYWEHHADESTTRPSCGGRRRMQAAFPVAHSREHGSFSTALEAWKPVLTKPVAQAGRMRTGRRARHTVSMPMWESV